ncbi:hypothetical protein P7K49_015943 [Saguinus oedipus]|uniref:Uncharacterized protein n=1 Tax=Saguinus oedipus TaxID=9490 RepID=A0ABQ9VAN2_SAGOE|nr:hypothetical protein P7K49_015943 [Saguinus oedipus]
MAAPAVFVHSGGRLGQALCLYLLSLALANVLFTLMLLPWLTYYLEATCRAARTAYYVSTYLAVAFFTATFLLVLVAYAPSGLGPAPAKTMVLGLLLVFALCLAPYHLLLTPRVAGWGSDGDRCHTTTSTSCTPSAWR